MRKLAKYNIPQIVNTSVTYLLDYYPFGSVMDGRTIVPETEDGYRFGFNGMENENDITDVDGGHLHFGTRIYDSRLGRWLSLDPLAKKYPDLSPYNFTGNNPIRFVDLDGEDFGVKINHSDKTIVLVATIYTINAKTYRQVLVSAGAWNTKSATIDGYNVSFQIKVEQPVTATDAETAKYNPSIVKNNGKYRKGLLYSSKYKLLSSKALRKAAMGMV